MRDGTLEGRVVSLYLDEKKSLREIAAEVGRSHVGVKNILLRNGVELRSRKVAQKNHIVKNRPPHIVSQDIKWKRKRSEAIAKGFASKTPEEIAEINRKKSEGAKGQWAKLSEKGRAQKISSLNAARIEFTKHGFASHNEKRINDILHQMGHQTTVRTKKYTAPYEVDIFIDDLMVAVEIDGPSHWSPIFGESELSRQQSRDAIKNAHFIYSGCDILRIICDKGWSFILGEKLAVKIAKVLGDIAKNEIKRVTKILLSEL